VGVDDIRARQEARQKQLTTWAEVAAGLRNQLQEALPSVGAEVASRTGLKLSVHPSDLTWRITETQLVFELWRLLELNLLHVEEHGASVYRLHTEVSQQVDGSWQIRVSDPPLEFRTVAPKPWLALSVGRGTWRYHMFWRGPEDKEKLTSAIVDAFSGRERSSDFTLREPAASSRGCGLVVAGLAAVALALVSLAR
jgi:hypothetical protein